MMRILDNSTGNIDYQLLLKEGENNIVWSMVSEILYIFKHSLLRDTIYDMQLRKRLRELHNTAALALQELFGEDETRYADIAFHFEKAKVRDKAVHFLKKAADYAKREYKNEQYLYHNKHLLIYAENDDEKAEINYKIAATLKKFGDFDSALKIYEDIIDYTKTSDNLKLKAMCLNRLGWISLSRGIPDDAMSKFKESKMLSEEINDPEGISRSLSNIASASIHKGEYEDALVMLSQSRDIAEKINNTERFAYIMQLMGKIHTRLGNQEKGIEYYKKFIKISRTTGMKHSLCIGLSLLGLNTDEMGDHDKAMVLYNEAIETAKEIGSKFELARSYNNLALLYENRGNYTKALHFYSLSYDMLLEIGNIRSALISLINIGLINGKLGNLDKAFTVLNEALTQSDRLDEQNRAYASAYIGIIYKYNCDFESAVKYFQEAEDIARNIKLPSIAALFTTHKVEVLIEMKKYEEALENINRALPILKKESDKKVATLLQIYETEVIAHYDNDEGIGKLTKLIDGFTDTKELAEGYYRLYRISGEEGHRRKAVKYREELITLLPEYNNKKVLEFLKGRGD